MLILQSSFLVNDDICIYIYIWVNLITTSLFSLTGIMVNKGNHPEMALFQVSELL